MRTRSFQSRLQLVQRTVYKNIRIHQISILDQIITEGLLHYTD